jgi:hypothetical protein
LRCYAKPTTSVPKKHNKIEDELKRQARAVAKEGKEFGACFLYDWIAHANSRPRTPRETHYIPWRYRSHHIYGHAQNNNSLPRRILLLHCSAKLCQG